MFGQSLLSGAFGSALDPGLYFNNKLYDGANSVQSIGGKIKGAADFGVSGSEFIDSQAPLPPTSAISFWVKTSSNPNDNNWVNLIDNGGSMSAQTGVAIFRAGNGGYINLYFTNGQSGQSQLFTGTTNICDGAWHNIVLSMASDDTFVLYLDGTSHLSGTRTRYTQGATPTFSYIRFGQKAGSVTAGNQFYGSMDQIRIYNSSLSTTEVAALNTETATTASTLDFPAGAGCIVGYTLDANANTIGPVPNSTTDVTTCDFPTGAGCQALYQLEDNVTDTCGNYNGTANNITYASGVFGNAASFNGTSSYVDIGGTIANSQSNLTVSMWLYWDGNTSNANDYFILLGNSSTGTAGSLFACNIVTASGILRFYNGSATYDSTSAISANTWTQIAITYASSGDLKFYISGTLDASHSAGALSLGASSNRGLIGGYVFASNPVQLYYGGLIDQVRIFNTVLTQSQVNELARGAQYNGLSTNITYPGFLNFQPDFTWQKSYSTNGAHNLLMDSVSGTFKNLFSNDPEPYYTRGVQSFDPYGFTLQTNTNMGNDGNVSGQNYITWNWKAGNEPLVADFDYGGGGTSSSSYIPLPGAVNGTNTSDLSISFWMKNPTNDRHMLASSLGDPGPGAYYTKYNIMTAPSSNAGKIRINFGNGSSQENTIYSTDNTWTDGNWHHLVYTMEWNGSYFDLKLYKDGVDDPLSTSNTSGTAVTSGNSTATIGGFNNGGTYYGYNSGSMSQIRYFDDVLTQSEVTALHNETPADYNTLNFPAGAGCIAAYPLNGNGNDLSGLYSSTSSFNMTYSKTGKDTVNNDGSVTSTVSANQDVGFSIVKYTGNGINGATVGHGLSALPDFILIKNVDITKNWMAWHGSLSGELGYLDNNAVFLSSRLSWAFNGTQPSTSLVTIGGAQNDRYTNGSGDKYIMYCWNSVAKYSKMGSYVGNNSSNPIDVGFQPAWVMAKPTSSSGSWLIMDSTRGANEQLYANSSDGQYTDSGNSFNATGFTMKSNGNWNASGVTYIYMAFAVPLT